MKVVVLMGGKSPEHEISLISGREVVLNLPKKYRVFPVVISKDGNTWRYVTKDSVTRAENILKLKGTKKDFRFAQSKKISPMEFIKRNADVVFIAMHGPHGEDGTVQGMLEMIGVPYTGPGVLSSALGMNKLLFREMLKYSNIPIPKYVAFRKNDVLSNIAKGLGKPPYFVKPNSQGSSVGCSIALKKSELDDSCKTAFGYDDTILVDEYIKGQEVTCAVLGNNEPIALPLVEIKPIKGDFFDYECKYLDGGAEEIVPARISKKVTKKVQGIAVSTYKALGCRGFSRVDFILKNGELPVVLEINTIPGLTPTSLFPKAAKAHGMTYSQLLDTIIKYAIEKN